MAILSFISDDQLLDAVESVLKKTAAGKKSAETNMYRNVVDPFSSLIDSAQQGVSPDQWIQQEKSRQAQKSLSNAVGEFHQEVLGAMPGWKSIPTGGGYDLINAERGVIAEVKNKYNSMNSSSESGVYDKMSGYLDNNEDFLMGYVVQVIPPNTKNYRRPYTAGEGRGARPDLFKIDGQSFYDFSSGEEDTLRRLYEALPKVLSQILPVSSETLTSSPNFTDLFQRAYGD